MLDKVKLVIGSVLAMRPALRRAYGWTWPLALTRCALRSGRVFRQTRWAGRRDAEARYVRTLALLPAICLDIRERLGERGPEIIRELTTAVTEDESARVVREQGLLKISDPRERWHAYFERTMTRGFGEFNENECLSVDPGRFHCRVFRCVFAELALETGVPEVARIICDSDVPFHRRLFPSYEFHRGGSARNTLAYGHPHCEYVWEQRPVANANGDDDDQAHGAASPLQAVGQPVDGESHPC